MGALRVLLVDDEEDLVSAMVERLRLRGLAADGALGGEAALACMAQKDYDVAVVDLKMPGLGGEELLRTIRKERPNTALVVITGHGAAGEGETMAIEGVHDYLMKPFDLEKLVQVMTEAVRARS